MLLSPSAVDIVRSISTDMLSRLLHLISQFNIHQSFAFLFCSHQATNPAQLSHKNNTSKSKDASICCISFHSISLYPHPLPHEPLLFTKRQPSTPEPPPHRYNTQTPPPFHPPHPTPTHPPLRLPPPTPITSPHPTNPLHQPPPPPPQPLPPKTPRPQAIPRRRGRTRRRARQGGRIAEGIPREREAPCIERGRPGGWDVGGF